MTDEHVDYAALSIDELIDVAGHIDREAFPDRAAVVDAELAKRRDAQETTFDTAIERYLRWRWIAFGSWLTIIPLELVIGMPLANLCGSDVPFFAVAITCGAVAAVFGAKVGMFKCPRCGQPFARKNHFTNSLTSSCVNCGLTHTR